MLLTWNNTGKSFTKVLILASTNPQSDKRLSIELPVQYMNIESSELVEWINCSECQSKNNLCTQHVLSLQFSCTELVIQWKTFLSYCGLVDARISASEKDLPVQNNYIS